MINLRSVALMGAVLLAAANLRAEEASTSQSFLRQLNSSFSGVFEKVAPSVVVIEATRARSVAVQGLPDGFNFFLRNPSQPAPRTTPNIGSGIILRSDGYILTNYHVVEDTDKVMVRLRDDRRLVAQVVGFDENSDLAVLKIDAKDLTAAEIGDSDTVKVGEFVFAIGTPMELPYTFTVGVVSAKGRNLGVSATRGYDEFIQTDASINPGNSGGPLADVDGRVVGVNTLISGSNRGLGFAVPINIAKDVAEQLIATGRVSRPWLGISIAGIEEVAEFQRLFPDVSRGVVVSGIEVGAPAQGSELRPGDVILKVDGVSVALARDLQREILYKKIGQSVALDIWRSGSPLVISVVTGERPDQLVRASVRSTTMPVPSLPAIQAPTEQPSFPGFTAKPATPDSLKEFNIDRQAAGGMIVTAVEEASAAAVAGLEVGDVITEIGGTPLLSQKDFDDGLSRIEPDRGTLLLLERNSERTFAILKP